MTFKSFDWFVCLINLQRITKLETFGDWNSPKYKGTCQDSHHQN